MSDERPTAAERADAAERFIDALDEAQAAITKAWSVLTERSAHSTTSYPLFSFVGEELRQLLDRARGPLWDAHKIAAVQAFDERRKAERDA